MPKPIVIQTEPYAPEAMAWLAQRCEVVNASSGSAEFAGLIGRAVGLAVRTYTKVDRAMLDQAPTLRVVARAGVALENIDVPACRQRGVQVVHRPRANTRAVVEFVTGLMLDALRSRLRLAAPMDAGAWEKTRAEQSQNRQLDRLTLGIWGLGNIGSGVARVGRALDMRVIYHDLRQIPPEARWGAEPVGVDQLLDGSDVLTIHVDSRAENRHLLDASSLSRLRPNAVVINTSRGFCVDPVALAAWLSTHPTARAMIDVHDPFEPVGSDYPLLGLENAVLTPHIAAGTREAKLEMSWVVRDIWRVLSGESPEFPAP